MKEQQLELFLLHDLLLNVVLDANKRILDLFANQEFPVNKRKRPQF